jgi:ATP-dependent DNA helicase RecG
MLLKSKLVGGWNVSDSCWADIGRMLYIRQAGFAPIQQEQMVLSYIDKHRSIKRADVMDLCHLDRNQAYRLLARMKEAGQIKQIGEKKGAVYERA